MSRWGRGGGGSVTEASVTAAGDFVRYNVDGNLINVADEIISGVPVVANVTDLPAAASFDKVVHFVTNVGPRGVYYTSDGTDWYPINGHCVLSKSSVVQKVIAPAVQASAIADNLGNLQITATAHALTTSPAVGCSVYISAWTGTGAPGFYEILSVDSVNTYTIDLLYAAGAPGTPTVSLANTEITIREVAIPPLLTTASLESDVTWSSSTSTNEKRGRIYLGTDRFLNINMNGGTTTMTRQIVRINNTGATDSQIGSYNDANGSMVGNGAGSLPTGTTQTNVATTLSYAVLLSTANEFMELTMTKLTMDV